MRIVTYNEIKELFKIAEEEFHLTHRLQMENFSVNATNFIEDEIIGDNDFTEVVVLAGKGNNGASGVSIARCLSNRGHRSRVFLLYPDEGLKDELAYQVEMAKSYGVKISTAATLEELEAYFTQTQENYFVIDAICGAGVKLPISNYLFDLINIVNNNADLIASIDMPSGIHGDTGEIGSVAINADITIAKEMPKLGHYIDQGPSYTGNLVVASCGLPSKLHFQGDKTLLTKEHVIDTLEKRSKFAHKNTFGHSVIVGGSKGLTGALILASQAALKTGTGLVSAVTWEQNYPELVTRVIPEVMVGTIPTEEDDVDKVVRRLERFQSIVIGPGLGRKKEARKVVLEVINYFRGPVVIDADALNVIDLDEDVESIARRTAPTVFTPHAGEFARMMKVDVQEILRSPIKYIRQFVDKTNSTIVLKGPCTFVGFTNGDIFLNYRPNDGMATGGSGDVLAGILGGVLAQNIPERKIDPMFREDAFYNDSISLSVLAHSLAGKHAANALGVRAMTAGSILEYLPNAFNEIRLHD